MMSPRIFIVLIVFPFLSTANGQSGFQPGYLTDHNHDTIRGLIEVRGETQNSQACHFKLDMSGELMEFLPGEIFEYRIEEGKRYVARTMEVNGAEEEIFIECLVNGHASLYYFRVKEEQVYFIEKEGDNMLTLTNDKKEVIVDGTKTLVYSQRYIRLLKGTFSDCLEIQSSIEKAKFNHRSLISLTCKYNEYITKGETGLVYNQSPGFRVRVGPLVGYVSNGFVMKGDKYFDPFDFNRSNNPVFGLELNLSSRLLGKHLSIQLGTDLGKSDFHAYYEEQSWISASTSYHRSADLQALSMRVYVGPKYSFTSGKVRPNLAGGIMLHKFIQPDFRYVRETHVMNQVTVDEYDWDLVSNLFFGAYVQAGLDVDLGQRLVLFTSIKAGFCTNNPMVEAGLEDGQFKQIRVSSEVIPITFSMGLFF